jgi:crotonobetainyl-CoA:carnitine CoA-transferase CaiB-like acyl-CoA transferase
MGEGALAGLRVLDLSTSVAGAWCSRTLADFGADVIMVEAPGGSPLRGLAPFAGDGTSIPAAYYLANKRSVTLDAALAGGREQALRLGRACDVVVSSMQPAALAEAGLTYADFATPSLIMAHVTPYGMTGERADLPGNDLTTAALSGWAYVNGNAGGEPLKMHGWQSSLCAGSLAYSGILAALHWREGHPGEGQEVDVAELDAMVSTFAPALLRGQYTGVAQERRKDADMTAGPVPVADGYFALTISRAHFWRDSMNVLGLHDLAEDERWGSGEFRAKHKDEYVRRVEGAMSGWTKMELFEELASHRVVAGPVLSMEELIANPHLRAREFWVTPEGSDTEYAGPPARLSRTPWALRAPMPVAGADDASVLDAAAEAAR